MCCFLSPYQVTATSSSEQEYCLSTDFTAATFSPRFGETTILLRKGFDFINSGSSSVDWELALTGVTLSDRVYNGTSAEELLKDLGYEKTKTTTPNESESNQVVHPVSSMGYKHISDGSAKGKNVFAIVIRGTENLFGPDGITDLYDGARTMFDISRGTVVRDLKEFIEESTRKSIDELKDEDNYFFLSGHSLGGAVANALSVDETVTSLCKGDKEHVYTYTFESPHTCVNLWWMDVEGMSNAYNIKDIDDAITNVAPYIGATTYGKDLTFSVNDLDNSIFVKVFPNANGISVTKAPHPQNYGDIFGHHDLGLCLVYIMQHGISDGWWDHVHKIDDYISMWTKDVVMVEKTNADWSTLYYQYLTENDKPIIYDGGSSSEALSENTGLALHDFDLDGIPELLVGRIFVRGLLYTVLTIKDGSVKYLAEGLGRQNFYSDNTSYHGLFDIDFYSGIQTVGYFGFSNGKWVNQEVIRLEYKDGNLQSSVKDQALYQVYLDCTEENESGSIIRDSKNPLKTYSWGKVLSNGWESFINLYANHGEQKPSEQLNHNERFYFTLGGAKISIELPLDWHAKTTTSNTGEDITFTVTETNGRDYTVCSLRCMTAIEYERVKEWYKSLGSSLEESAEYYGNKGDYYYAMVWSDGYGYDPSTQLVIDKALRISHDVAKTFQFCD